MKEGRKLTDSKDLVLTVRRVFIKWGVDTAVAHMPCAVVPLSLSLSL
jgi:hypothetical protein